MHEAHLEVWGRSAERPQQSGLGVARCPGGQAESSWTVTSVCPEGPSCPKFQHLPTSLVDTRRIPEKEGRALFPTPPGSVRDTGLCLHPGRFRENRVSQGWAGRGAPSTWGGAERVQGKEGQ